MKQRRRKNLRLFFMPFVNFTVKNDNKVLIIFRKGNIILT